MDGEKLAFALCRDDEHLSQAISRDDSSVRAERRLGQFLQIVRSCLENVRC